LNKQRFFEKYAIDIEFDLVKIRQVVRKISKEMQFDIVAQTKLLTAVSELARNVFDYVGKGEVIVEEVGDSLKIGLKITVIDNGPGIPDIDLAMSGGFSTSKGLGKGLSGTKKLMDEFSIQSEVGKGTEVVIVKWVA
jgi:serine/threonine-protein kinase RsbT